MSGYRAALTANLGTGWALFGVRQLTHPALRGRGAGPIVDVDGIGFFVSAAAQGLLLLPVGRFVDTTGRRPAMIIGAAVASLSMALITIESVAVYVIAMTLFGVGAAFLSVAPSAAVGDVFSGRGGTVVAAFQMSADLGAVAGPLIAGWLAEQYSFGAAFIATAGVLALGLVMAVASRETRHRGEPGAAAGSRAGFLTLAVLVEDDGDLVAEARDGRQRQASPLQNRPGSYQFGCRRSGSIPMAS